jgi:hypothetical protein
MFFDLRLVLRIASAAVGLVALFVSGPAVSNVKNAVGGLPNCDCYTVSNALGPNCGSVGMQSCPLKRAVCENIPGANIHLCGHQNGGVYHCTDSTRCDTPEDDTCGNDQCIEAS